jgi:tartrate-resistant acid phosphatase type 5
MAGNFLNIKFGRLFGIPVIFTLRMTGLNVFIRCSTVNMMHKLILMAILTVSCSKDELIGPVGFETDIKSDSIVFAQIGDFGHAGQPEEQVCDMVKSWNPDFIITTGDNNYNEGKFSTIKENISHYYGDFIYNFDAPVEFLCNGKAFTDQVNRFFPCPGNHDAYNAEKLIPYLNFFTLPGKEIYYKFTWGPVSFFSLSTVNCDLGIQKNWLLQQLSCSDSPFNIVYFHHSPYSVSNHGGYQAMQWDFDSMGVDVVFTGHDHVYEHIEKKEDKNVHYIVNGIGGMSIYSCESNPLSADTFSVFCDNSGYGAVKVAATYEKMIIEYYTVNSPQQPSDRLEITASR